jgi:hypothetical protein
VNAKESTHSRLSKKQASEVRNPRAFRNIPWNLPFPCEASLSFRHRTTARTSDQAAVPSLDSLSPALPPVSGGTNFILMGPTSASSHPQKSHFHMGFWTRTERLSLGIARLPLYGNGKR